MTLILGILSSAGSLLLKTLGLPMCVLIGFYFWEEGAPFASYLVIPASVPLVGGFGVGNIIPLLGDLAIGHVQSRVNEAVAGARHGFAIEQENAAAKAQHDTEAENARKAAVVTAGFNILLSKTNAQKNQTSKDYTDAMQRAAKAAAAAGIKCDRLDAGRADVLRKHGFKIIE